MRFCSVRCCDRFEEVLSLLREYNACFCDRVMLDVVFASCSLRECVYCMCPIQIEFSRSVQSPKLLRTGQQVDSQILDSDSESQKVLKPALSRKQGKGRL